MPNRQQIYWDSPVWLSYINGEADRLPILDAILAEAASANGSVEIYTSVISQVEVAFAKSEEYGKALDPEIEGQIDQLWADRDAVKLVEFYDDIGKDARQLMRNAITRGWKLKPMDAIHLATAKKRGVVEIHTYDEPLFKYADVLGIPIRLPHSMQSRMGI